MKHSVILLATVFVALVAAIGGFSAPATAAAATLPSAIEIDRAAKTVTLPLFEGRTASGEPTWYVVTESSDRTDAQRRGVNWAPKLANALRGTGAVQRVTAENGIIQFPGTVDFSPAHEVSPGPTGFPPSVAKPGSVGDDKYSPLITTCNGAVLNAE